MTAIPARVAGVPQVALCVPPDASGSVPAVTLAAAAAAGVDEVYRVGGAQAIAALAYGTESVTPVDVIVGPGNLYVAMAKQLVAGQVGVPSAFAGPSEVVVVADDRADPRLVAIDLMVQAEHGPDGLAWLVSWDPEVADRVDRALAEAIAQAPRSDDITATMAASGYSVICDGRRPGRGRRQRDRSRAPPAHGGRSGAGARRRPSRRRHLRGRLGSGVGR